MASRALERVRIHKVVDGDTVHVVPADAGYGAPHSAQGYDSPRVVRLAGIDAPEIAQPYGAESAGELNAILFDPVNRLRPLLLEGGDQLDKYGRVLGRLYVDLGEAGMLDVNGEMVSRGAAWVYRRFNYPADYALLEQRAQRRGAGLWSFRDGPLVPPWEWRERMRRARRR